MKAFRSQQLLQVSCGDALLQQTGSSDQHWMLEEGPLGQHQMLEEEDSGQQ